jgi:peroxiredoxin family protein
MAAMMASVGAVSERPVELFVSMNAILAFGRDGPTDVRESAGPFSRMFKEKRAPDAFTLLRQGKELGELKLWACSMALDLLGWEMERLPEKLFDGSLGLTKFLSDAETGQLVTL